MKILSFFLAALFIVAVFWPVEAQVESTEEALEDTVAGVAAESEAPAERTGDEAVEEVIVPRKLIRDMTASELAENITQTLNNSPQLLNFLPMLKKETDSGGIDFYVYNGRRLGALDREELMSILRRIRSELTRINVERINRQLATVRQGQAAALAAQGPEVPMAVPVPPKVPSISSSTAGVPRQVQLPRPPPLPPRQTEAPKVPRVPSPPSNR